MRDQSAFLKLSFVKAELSRLLTARQITNDEFVTASRMIELEEQRLINELPQMGAVFLQAVNELKSMGLPEELASKLQNSYLSDSEVAADSGEDTAVLQQPEEIAQEQEDNESEEILPTQIVENQTQPELETTPSPVETVIPATVVSRDERSDKITRRVDLIEVFQSFLLERNIRWVELVATLMIVGFSIPLAITLWQLNNPIVKYLVFLTTTLAIFGGGWYTLVRLLLPITGKIFSISAFLLIPLHFLALDLMGSNLRYLGIVVLVVLGGVSYLFTRFLKIENAITWIITYLMLSGLHLTVEVLTARFSTGIAIATIAWLIFIIGVTRLKFQNSDSIEQTTADQIYFCVGTLNYAFAFLLIRIPFSLDSVIKFSHLSPLIFLGILPSLYYGRQLAYRSQESCNGRTVGLIILACGYLITILVVALGVSVKGAISLTTLLVAIIYSYLALNDRKPLQTYMTIISFGLFYVTISFILIAQVKGVEFSWVPSASVAEISLILVPLSLVYWVCGHFLKRKDISQLAIPIHWAGTCLAGLLTIGSLSQPAIASFVLIFYAVACIILANQWKQIFFTYWACGSLVAGISFLFYRLGVDDVLYYVLMVALVASAYLATGKLMSKQADLDQWRLSYRIPLINSSIVLTLIATVLIGITIFSAGVWTGWINLIIGLFCSLVITINFISYSTIYELSSLFNIPLPLFIYLASAAFLGTILGTFHQLLLLYEIVGLGHYALMIAMTASVYLILGKLVIKPTDFNQRRLIYQSPLFNSSMVLTSMTTILVAVGAFRPLQGWAILVTSLLCGTMVTVNFTFYTPIYQSPLFVYLSNLTCFGTILGAVYKLNPPHIFDWSILAILIYTCAAFFYGSYLLQRSADSHKQRLYAYPLVNSSLVASILLVIGSLNLDSTSLPAITIRSLAAFSAAILYLLTQKIYLRNHWLYAFQILFSWGILCLTGRLAHSYFSDEEILAYTISIVLCLLANMWILVGLAVRRWKTAICSIFKLPIQDYSAPFFLWATIVVASAFFIIGILQIVFLLDPILSDSKMVILISQTLISLALFFHLYRGFRMLHTILLYISGWLVFVCTSIVFGLSNEWLILMTAVYAAVWHLILRCKDQVRDLLQKIQLTFPGTENITLITTIETLLYCNTAFVLLMMLLEVSSGQVFSYQSIVSIFLIAFIYLANAFERKEENWSYLGMVVFTLGSYALTSAILPVTKYSPWITMFSCGLMSVGLGYFWSILGISINKRNPNLTFFTEACKWMGIALVTIAALVFIAFMASTEDKGTLAKFGVLAFGSVAIFYFWTAWRLQRELFVYVGEATIIGILFFTRLVVPEWFNNDIFRQFWPIGVVAVSFVVLGLSQIFQRVSLDVFIRPSRYTSFFLTLIPLVGMPLVSSLEITPVTVLTVAATTVFYLTVTWIEYDIPYIYITCVFLNLTIAVFWAWWGIAFKMHPQLFVAPIGFSLIFITYLNRSDLSLEMMRRFRSFAGIIIYASSFAELFTATGFWSPIILAVICVLGILAGIALRIRHFLYLGTVFLLLDILIQIFEAGKGNAWIWWISGISLGMAILVLFAWFERKKDQILGALNLLREWD